MNGTDIKNMNDFQTYVKECTDGQLIGLAVECAIADNTGSFYGAHFCLNVYNTILAEDKHLVGVNVILDMMLTISMELVRRIAKGTFSIEEYQRHYDMAQIMRKGV